MDHCNFTENGKNLFAIFVYYKNLFLLITERDGIDRWNSTYENDVI